MATTAVIYCRVSTKSQEDDGTSLDTQREGCEAFCKREGLEVEGVYTDAHSGADMDRLGLRDALEAIRTHKASVLVAYALDRLSRNQVHQAVILHQVEEQSGGKLELVTEKLDDSAHGRFLRSAMAFVSEVEREKIMERTQRGRRRRVENGKPLGHLIPIYGYLWTDDTRTQLMPDPETAWVVQRIFDEIMHGKSLRSIAIRLTEEGRPTPSQRHADKIGKRKVSTQWRMSVIRFMLHNPAYKGRYIAYRWLTGKQRRYDPETGQMRKVQWKKERTEADGANTPVVLDVCPALVMTEVWTAVQEQLLRNKLEAPRNNKEPHKFLLRSGFAFCAYCGQPMIVHLFNTKYHYYRYVCRSKTSEIRCTGGMPSADAGKVDTNIWNKVQIILNTNAVILALTRRMLQTNGDEANEEALRSQLTGIEATIVNLQKRRANLLRMQADAEDDEIFDEFGAQVKDTKHQIEKLKKDREEVAEQLETLAAANMTRKVLAKVPGGISVQTPGETSEEAARRIVESWAKAVQETELSYDEKRGILRYLGIRVEFYRGDDKRPDGTTWEMYTSLEGLERIYLDVNCDTKSSMWCQASCDASPYSA